MGGVTVLVKDNDNNSALKVAEGNYDTQVLVTRHSQFRTPIKGEVHQK